MSPVKQSDQCKYFRCELQTESGVSKAVCYAPERKTTFDMLRQQKSPVKIKKYSISNKFNTEDVQISRYTDVLPLTDDTEMGFTYKEVDTITTISSVADVTSGQLVSVKGKVLHLTSQKKVVYPDKVLQKQECYIVDPTGQIKVTLWEDYTDQVEQGKTYNFRMFRLRKMGQDRSLNTPKDDDRCVISETTEFQEPLPTLQDVSLTNTKEMTAEILGVHSVTRSYGCCACKRKVNVSANGKLAQCTNESCRMTQKSIRCITQWSLKLVVQDTVLVTPQSNTILPPITKW